MGWAYYKSRHLFYVILLQWAHISAAHLSLVYVPLQE